MIPVIRGKKLLFIESRNLDFELLKCKTSIFKQNK